MLSVYLIPALFRVQFSRDIIHAGLSYSYNSAPRIENANNIGYVFLSTDVLDKAEVLFNRAIELHTSSVYAERNSIFPALPMYNRGVLYAERGQVDNALTDFKATINLAQNLKSEEREVSWLWVPVWNDDVLTFEEKSSPDLLEVAYLALAAIEKARNN